MGALLISYEPRASASGIPSTTYNQPGMAKKRIFIAWSLVAALILLLTSAYLFRAHIGYALITHHHSADDSIRADELAIWTSKQPGGVSIAANNVRTSVWRGYHYDWVILTESPHTDDVVRHMQAIVTHEHNDSDRTSIAYQILWEQTRDEQHLVELFRFAKDPGDKDTQTMRIWLMLPFIDAGYELDEYPQNTLHIPYDQPLTITENQYRDALEKALNQHPPE